MAEGVSGLKFNIRIMFMGVLVLGMVYTGMCFSCMAAHNSVSEEDYARMAQEIVDQSLQP